LHLRWTITLGQVVLILLAHFGLRLTMPLRSLAPLLLLGMTSHLLLALWIKREPQLQHTTLSSFVALDMLQLTALLHLTGGPANPFSVLYVVYVVLGLILLPLGWIWFLSLFTLFCYGSLFWLGESGHDQHALHDPAHMRMHLEGMWLAYALATLLIVFFVARLKNDLTQKEAALRELEAQQARNEKLASLAALATGAMHEMATPLSTIALIAKELERDLKQHPKLQSECDDAAQIRTQVEACHRILRELVHHAGGSLGEAPQPISLRDFVDEILLSLPTDAQKRCQLDIPPRLASCALLIPSRSFQRALRGLIDNALEASPPESSILLLCETDEHSLLWRIKDQGCGMKPAVLAQASEPFFSTKAAGQGHGLGLFLAKTITEQLGGRFLLESRWQEGTQVSLFLPLSLLSLPKESAQDDPPTLHPHRR
jgi:two-component system sensor histidine kinase RegB